MLEPAEEWDPRARGEKMGISAKSERIDNRNFSLPIHVIVINVLTLICLLDLSSKVKIIQSLTRIHI